MLQAIRDYIQQRLTTSQLARMGLSLLIAVLLWGWVTQLQDPVETQRYSEITIVPPELRGTLQIVTSLPRTTVSITDVSSDLNDITRADITATLDASSIDGAGTYQLPVIVDLDTSVREMRVSPDTVSVQVEEVISRNLPLSVEVQGDEGETRRVVDTNAEVSEVTVTGSTSAVQRVDRVILPVSAQGRSTDFVEMIEPQAVDENNQPVLEVEVIPAHVRTEIDLEARGKTVSIVPQITGAPADGFVVQQQIAVPETVIVDGPPEVLEDLLFINTEPVDISGASESISRMVALEGLPEGATLIEPEENRIEVRISIGASGGTANTIPDMPVEIVNLGEGLEATVDPTSANIDVSATSEVLTSLTPEDVSLTVDVSGLGPGVYTLEPQVDVPENVNVIQVDPAQVVVLISETAATPAANTSPGGRLSATAGD